MIDRRRMMVEKPHVIDGVIQDSWETIIKICKAGQAKNYYTAGDHKLITCAGQTFYMDYLGQGLDSPHAYVSDKSKITSWLARTVPWSCQFDPTYYGGYWPNSAIREFCRTTIYNGFPENVRSAIEIVFKQDNFFMWSPMDDEDPDAVWIPSESDVLRLYKERFPDDLSRQKDGASKTWWTGTQNIHGALYTVEPDGSISSGNSPTSVYGLVPGFCI